MRAAHLLLLTPLVVAACSSPPPPRPIVVNQPATNTVYVPTPGPTTTVVVPADSNAMVQQCQNIFAQTFGGQTVSFGAPSINAIGDTTAIKLTGTAYGTSLPRQYACTFTRGQLSNSGQL